MSLVPINRDLSKRQLALFGAVWLIVFGVLGAVLWRGGFGLAAGLCWAAAAAVPAAGCVVPGLLRAVYLGMVYTTFPFGFLLSLFLLAVVYYAVLTPVGLVLRLLRHDPMGRRRDEKAATYWCPREDPGDPARYFRQF